MSQEPLYCKKKCAKNYVAQLLKTYMQIYIPNKALENDQKQHG